MTYQPYVYRKQGGNELVVASGGTITLESGAIIAPASGSVLSKGYIQLPLGSFRIISANAIPAIAVASGNGGQLASDSAPALARVNGATDKALRLVWAASSSIEITSDNIVYPLDLDDTAAVTIKLMARMAGATDTPVISVGYFEGVGDTNAGGDTAALSATVQTLSVAIAAADVGAAPTFATVTLTPGAHTTDALWLYGAWIEYVKKTTV